MIKHFKSKGLEELFVKGQTSKLPQERLKKMRKILAVLNSANTIKDLDNPSFRLHQLKAPPYIGYWSIDISGNYRLIFRFEEKNIYDLDYLDTH